MARGLDNGIAKALAILSVVAMLGSPANADDGGVLLPQTEAEPVSVRLSATTPDEVDPAERLQVFVGAADPCCEGRTPMAGRYALTDDTLAFSPAFGFDPSQDYTARVRTGQNEHALYAFRLPHEVAAAPAAVTEVYPSGETLPENVLRFYIHFSTPMAPHVAFDYIKLRDSSGNADDAAFMRFKQELWNEDRTRLTVLIDPGRIKTRGRNQCRTRARAGVRAALYLVRRTRVAVRRWCIKLASVFPNIHCNGCASRTT